MSADLQEALIRVLRAMLSEDLRDFWGSRDVTRDFLLLLPRDVVDEIWRDYWGRGLFDED